MESHRLAAIALAAALLGVTIATATAPVAAQDANPIEDALEDGDGYLGAAYEATRAYVERVLYQIRHSGAPVVGGEDSPAAEEQLDELGDYYNPRSAEFERWVNSRSNASESYDVVAIEIQLEGETSTGYLVADVNGSEYENTSIVESTNRAVDHNVTVCGYAAEKAPDELEEFYLEFVEPDEDVSAEYLGRLRGAYWPYVDTSLVESGGGKC